MSWLFEVQKDYLLSRLYTNLERVFIVSAIALTEFQFVLEGSWLIFIINAIGPSLLPWGMPPLISIRSDFTPWNVVICDRPCKYDANQSDDLFTYSEIYIL